MRYYILIFFVMTCMTLITFGGIVHVPGDQPTIQAGIEVATERDTVLVADGRYYENINFKGKAITVASHFLIDDDTSHISKTIIDGSQPANPDSGSVVYLESGEDTTSVLMGFTITNGTGTKAKYTYGGIKYDFRGGGGIYCWNSGGRFVSNKIMNNTISSSEGDVLGGGLGAGDFGSDAWVILEKNTIINNAINAELWFAYGGGVGLTCNGKLFDNVISYNSCTAQKAEANGGGVKITAVSQQMPRTVLIKGNQITHNFAKGKKITNHNGAKGGGIVNHYCKVIILENDILYNQLNAIESGDAYGSGIYMYLAASGSVINGNTISFNSIANNITSGGGGIGLRASQDVSITNNVISGNSASQGGGIWLRGYFSDIINNTIVGNMASTRGGGLCSYNSKPVVINAILWNNQASEDPQISGYPIVAYSNIQDTIWEGVHNISVDPLFADTLFHLSDSSRCIGTGITSYSLEGKNYYAPEYDFERNIRPSAGSRKPDIGAMENSRSYPLLPVIQIPDDYSTIQAGIDAASNGDTVLVAEGLYYENLSIVDKSITLASYFLIDSDISHISNTIIDGSQPINTANATAVSITNSLDTTYIHGFTITGGYGTRVQGDGRVGGGILGQSSNLIISDNYIVDNEISHNTVPHKLDGATGAGISISPWGVENTFVHIKDNIIENNYIESEYTAAAGIALIVFSDVINLNFIIEGNEIKNNINNNLSEWKAMGGGITLIVYIPTKGTQIIRNNLISKNEVKCSNVSNSHSFGGGIYILLKEATSIGFEDSTSAPLIYNNIFEGNFSDYYGGAASVWRTYWPFNSSRAYSLQSKGKYTPKPSFINNTFVNNVAEKDGAAFYIMNHKPFFMNNILWNIYPKNAEYGEIFLGDEEQWTEWVEGNTYGSAEMFYNNIQGGWDVESGKGNIDYEPMFADSLCNLSEGSYCVGNGIASIDLNGISYNCPSTDIYGNDRPSNADDYVDIGAIESSYSQVVGVKYNKDYLPKEYKVRQNYPNPFNPITKISYSIPNQSYVSLKVFDVLGREVASLVNEEQPVGNYEVDFDATQLTSGIYFYRIQAGQFIESKKMVLMK